MQRRTFVTGLVGAGALASLGATALPARGRAVVAADHALASEAGAAVLRRGGNAVDAAVAAALAAGVVAPAGSGLGGGGFAVLRTPKGDLHVLDFRETAPAAATATMFVGPDGKVVDKASTDGGLAVGVIAEARGLWALRERFGAAAPKDVAAPAIALARDGFVITPTLARSLADNKRPSVAAWYSRGGRALVEGDTFTNPALAKTIERWVTTRGEVLNAGPGAALIVAAVKAAGGVLTAEDLAGYRPKDRAALTGAWGQRQVITMPPPSSGGVAILQMLRVLEGLDLAALGLGSSDYLHLLVEVMKYAYADRAHHLGDPDFVDVPVARLLSDARVEEIRRGLYPTRTWATEHYGSLVAGPKDAGTQHISVVDADGGACALTTTINTSFGSGLVVPELGILLNNQMDDFAVAPGRPNAFGLVGGAANAVAANKRPLSSMSPTIVVGERGVEIVVGASGGAQIISSVLQALLAMLVFRKDATAAVAMPRVHHQWLPDKLVVEPEIPRDVQRALEARGHVIDVRQQYACVQAVRITDGRVEGGCDPRKGGAPAVVY